MPDVLREHVFFKSLGGVGSPDLFLVLGGDHLTPDAEVALGGWVQR